MTNNLNDSIRRAQALKNFMMVEANRTIMANTLEVIASDPILQRVLERNISLCNRGVIPDPPEPQANWNKVPQDVLNEHKLPGPGDYDPIMKFLMTTPAKPGNSAWAD